MTDEQRAKLLQRFREQPSKRRQVQQWLERSPMITVRIEVLGTWPRELVSVTQEDMNIVLGQLTLLGEL